MSPKNPESIKAWYFHATPEGEGAISAFLLGGGDCWPVLKALLDWKQLPDAVEENAVYVGRLRHHGVLLDDIVLGVLQNHDGFQEFELNCHGGFAVREAVVACLRENGFEALTFDSLIKARESSGVWDCLQAEAAKELSCVASAKTSVLLLAVLNGALSRHLETLAKGLETNPASCRMITEELEKMLKAFSILKKYLRPSKVVLAGKPNAGKSSLFNALSGKDKALVTDIEGTTVDPLRCLICPGDLPLELCDTAGFRDTIDEVESAGLHFTREEINQADILLYVMDSNESFPTGGELAFIKGKEAKSILVWNKCDLCMNKFQFGDLPLPQIAVSAKTGFGLEDLLSSLSNLILKDEVLSRDQHAFFTQRQAALALRIIHELDRKSISSAKALFRNLITGKAVEKF